MWRALLDTLDVDVEMGARSSASANPNAPGDPTPRGPDGAWAD